MKLKIKLPKDPSLKYAINYNLIKAFPNLSQIVRK
jgi:hypothetical protein